MPWSSRVDSLTNYNHSESVDDDLNVERLVDGAESLSDEDLARIRKIALAEPSIAGRLVSHGGRVAGLVISFTLPEHSDAAEIQTYHYLRGLLDKTRATHPDIAYHVTGNVFVNQVLTEAAQDDMGILAPAFLIILAVGMLVAYVYSMTLLPALLSVLPLRARGARAGAPLSSIASALSWWRAARPCSGPWPQWPSPWWLACPASS